MSPVLFGLAGAVAMATSTSHLGRKKRFYRAVLNFKRSWVSREIVFFTVFMGGAIYSLVATPNNAVTVQIGNIRSRIVLSRPACSNVTVGFVDRVEGEIYL